MTCQCQLGASSGTLCGGYERVTLAGSGNVCTATVAGISMEDAGLYFTHFAIMVCKGERERERSLGRLIYLSMLFSGL